MTEKTTTRDTEIQALLLEAVEIQLAAFKANITFWSEWVDEATRFSEEAIRRLSELQSDPAENSRILLEMTDLSRESLRSMTHLPRRAAESFIQELDKFEQAKKPRNEGGTKPKAKTKAKTKAKAKAKAKAKRVARVKP